ncbi:hypothetical protein SAMN05444365_101485 [Micromonospora pattaloongensis]|uniref:WD40-like Beta Propeller Repeat n=2 Tax=Micromonospora pattaloongensis TaxID=405436 RepID=A0A1H3GMS3_9ACTN|nr:hypothetical protein SAMN05444365_101485 [Micromonospora pattaloongensis]
MALRQCLAHQAAPSPTLPDLAASAIRRGQRIRRRRSATAVAVVVLTAAAGGAGGWQLAGPAHDRGPRVPVARATSGVPVAETTTAAAVAAPAEPLPAPARLETRAMAAAAAPVDLVVGDLLRTTGGERIDLSGVGRVTQAQRGGGGWLIVAATRAGRSALWMVTRTAPPKQLLSAVDEIVLAPDGRRVVWLHSGRASVATAAAGRLTGLRETPVPPRGRPVGFVGDGVLLTRQLSGGEIEGYDVWWPDRGPYQPAWNPSLIGVYGPMPDGRTLVAQVAGEAGRPCLALLASGPGLPVVKRACALPLTGGGAGTVSPDGRWLVANGTTPSTPAATPAAESALLVELPTAFRPRAAAHAAGPRLTGGPAWTDAATLIHPGGPAELVRLSVTALAKGDPEAVERLPVAGARADEHLVVAPGPLA